MDTKKVTWQLFAVCLASITGCRESNENSTGSAGQSAALAALEDPWDRFVQYETELEPYMNRLLAVAGESLGDRKMLARLVSTDPILARLALQEWASRERNELSKQDLENVSRSFLAMTPLRSPGTPVEPITLKHEAQVGDVLLRLYSGAEMPLDCVRQPDAKACNPDDYACASSPAWRQCTGQCTVDFGGCMSRFSGLASFSCIVEYARCGEACASHWWLSLCLWVH